MGFGVGRVKKAEKKEICGLNEKYIYSKLLHTLQETFDGKLDALTFILRLDGLDFDSKCKIDSNTSCRRFYRKGRLSNPGQMRLERLLYCDWLKILPTLQ